MIYRGTLFDTFLVVERGEQAWIIDQHAAHERILYERFMATRSAQKLLVAEEFEVTEDQDHTLQTHREEYVRIGIELERLSPRRWALHTVPTAYRQPAEDLIETILEVGGLNDQFDRRFIAEMACKAACKAGDYLDGISAVALAEQTLSLPEPRCPHGRPLYIELSHTRLKQLIGRV